MKEKSVMEDKIFDFAKTRDALSELSADLIELEAALKIKHNSLAADKQKSASELQEKTQKLAVLTKTAEEALTKIDAINQYIDEVL